MQITWVIRVDISPDVPGSVTASSDCLEKFDFIQYIRFSFLDRMAQKKCRENIKVYLRLSDYIADFSVRSKTLWLEELVPANFITRGQIFRFH